MSDSRLRTGLGFLLTILVCGSSVMAHSPNIDADFSDWCLGAPSHLPAAQGGDRVEDSAIELMCGNCSIATNVACEVDSDCAGGGGTCVNLTSKTETVWWDNRTDGAVNDLGTIAVTQDNSFLYIAAQLWVDPDPQSLPFGQVAIDYTSGGLDTWDDPFDVLVAPGHCSSSTGRACTTDQDCHFCTESTEPSPSTRKRTCGSGCSGAATDPCITTETCVNIGQNLIQGLSQRAGPAGFADYLINFDFSFWLAGLEDGSALLKEPGSTLDPASPWDPVTGCTPDFLGDNTWCDFNPAVDPGESGGSGGPPGGVEVAIPWSAFGCTGCPGACSCPGFGPGQDFRFSIMVARGTSTLDWRVDGAIEDVVSEVNAQAASSTTTTTNSCDTTSPPPPNDSRIDNTTCELRDNSQDGWVPRGQSLPHEQAPGGRVYALTMDKGTAPSVTLSWGASCSVGDTDYGIYEGTIGNWYSHLCALASTGGATTATINAGAGNVYYLVVPRNATSEGSYGLDSTPAERPQSTSPCVATQSIGNCP